MLVGRTPAGLTELERLVQGTGLEIVHTVVQKRGIAGASAGLAKGRLEQLAQLIAPLSREGGPITVVIDEPLRPGQLRHLAEALDVAVVDRADIILRIFAQRARTRVAKLEVELARVTYDMPRVRDVVGDDDRGGGGGGRGERGHTNTQLEKSRLRNRRAAIVRELGELRAQADAERARRSDLPTVALVGYTNAGKSSLMRALTGSDVLIADQLFATLGTTVRALAPATAPRVLVTDTVGFIQDLPHELVASFRATLAEAEAADLLLFVVDAGDDAWADHLEVTRATTAAIGAAAVPHLVVFNKIDRADAQRRAALAAAHPDALLVSAHDRADVARVRAAITGFVDERLVDDALAVPRDRLRLIGEIHASAHVVAESYDDDGAKLRVRATPSTLARLRRDLPDEPPIATPAELVALARRHGIAITDSPADFDGSGLDFRVVHARDAAGTSWILRTPRRPEVFATTLPEGRVLRLCAPRVPVAVPHWQVHARAVIAYPRLPGTPALTIGQDGTPTWNIIDPAAPGPAFLDSCAAFLAALQAIDGDAVRRAGLPARGIAEERHAIARTMDEVRSTLNPPDTLWARWQAWVADDDLWPEHVALVHGDLHPGHLLLGDDGRVTGVLDWTEAGLGDPATDLAMFHGCFGAAGLAALLPRFERLGGRTWPRLAEHAAHRWAAFPAHVAAWALRTDNDSALAHARWLMGTQVQEQSATPA